jgi:hypothetical protein
MYVLGRLHTIVPCLAVSALLSPAPAHAQVVISPSPGIIVSAGVGLSHMDLGGTKFMSKTDFLNLETIDHVSDHDGDFDGLRVNGEIDVFTGLPVFGHQARLALRGFFAHHENKQHSSCDHEPGVSDCVIFPLIDPRPAGGADYTGGLFSDWKARTDREVHNWGAALEMKLSRAEVVQASIKDAPVVVASPFVWRLGVAVKELDQRTDFEATEFGPLMDPVSLHETLNTTYYGIYAGFDSKQELGDGFALVLNGEGGVYLADTRFRGHFFATDTISTPEVPLEQDLTLSDDRAAFIGLLGVELRKSFGFADVGVFAQAEWYSFVPNIKHNDFDHNGGFPFDVAGRHDGTRIGDGSAFIYTVGTRISVPLQ